MSPRWVAVLGVGLLLLGTGLGNCGGLLLALSGSVLVARAAYLGLGPSQVPQQIYQVRYHAPAGLTPAQAQQIADHLAALAGAAGRVTLWWVREAGTLALYVGPVPPPARRAGVYRLICPTAPQLSQLLVGPPTDDPADLPDLWLWLHWQAEGYQYRLVTAGPPPPASRPVRVPARWQLPWAVGDPRVAGGRPILVWPATGSGPAATLDPHGGGGLAPPPAYHPPPDLWPLGQTTVGRWESGRARAMFWP